MFKVGDKVQVKKEDAPGNLLVLHESQGGEGIVTAVDETYVSIAWDCDPTQEPEYSNFSTPYIEKV